MPAFQVFPTSKSPRSRKPHGLANCGPRCGSQSVRFWIRDFFNNAEPDALAVRAAAEDEFAAGGLEPHAGLVPRFGEVASQAAYLPSGRAFFGVHNFLLVKVANRRPGRVFAANHFGIGCHGNMVSSKSLVVTILVLQRTQIRHHRHGVVMIETKLRHGPHGRFAGEINAGFQKLHRLLVGEAGQPRNRRGHRGKRHRVVRLDVEDVSLQPLRAVELAVVVTRRVAIRAHRHVLHQIFAALDLRVVGRWLRPEQVAAEQDGCQTQEQNKFVLHARFCSSPCMPQQVERNGRNLSSPADGFAA